MLAQHVLSAHSSCVGICSLLVCFLFVCSLLMCLHVFSLHHLTLAHNLTLHDVMHMCSHMLILHVLTPPCILKTLTVNILQFLTLPGSSLPPQLYQRLMEAFVEACSSLSWTRCDLCGMKLDGTSTARHIQPSSHEIKVGHSH